MRRVTGTAAPFLFLFAAAMGATLDTGWSELAERAGDVVLMERLHWPSEIRARGGVAPR